MEVSLGKTLQSPSLVLVKPRKDMNNVKCHHDMSKVHVLLKAALNTIQSTNQSTKHIVTAHVLNESC